MKLICDGLDLSNAVFKVSKALAIKTPNPVLEGIKLNCAGDFLTLTATDMELTIIEKIKADVIEEGETVVVGKYFADFSKKLENEQVELSKFEEGTLLIKYGDSSSNLQVYPVENYPNINKLTDGNCFEIKQKDFKKVVEHSIFSCATDDSRPILKGCLFEIKDGILNVVALDGFRMTLSKVDVNSTGDFSAVIPSRTLNEIVRLLDKEDENLRVIINKNILSIEVENTILISRLIEGEFVKYSHILPTNFNNKVTVNKNDFVNSIERATIVGRNDKYNFVKLEIKDNIMKISSKSEVGDVKETLNITLEGQDITIAFNGKYLLDFLKIVTDDFITLSLNSSIDPCILKSINDENFIYLVLPVRISE